MILSCVIKSIKGYNFKQLYILVLFLVLVLPYVCLFSCYYSQRSILHEKVKQDLISGNDNRELILLMFSKTDAEEKLEWKEEFEFEYIGKMYDVVKTFSKKDSVVYYCWEDKKETSLNTKFELLLAELTEEDTEDDKEKHRCIVSFFKEFYLIGNIDFIFFDNAGLLTCFNSLELSYQYTLSSPAGPPPEFI